MNSERFLSKIFEMKLAHWRYNVILTELRGGTTVDPVLNVKEVGHVKHMHADSLLIHSNFSSKLMIT